MIVLTKFYLKQEIKYFNDSWYLYYQARRWPEPQY